MRPKAVDHITMFGFVDDQIFALGVQKAEMVFDQSLLHLLIYFVVRGRIEKASAAQILVIDSNKSLMRREFLCQDGELDENLEPSNYFFHVGRTAVVLHELGRFFFVILARLFDESLFEQALVKLDKASFRH